MKRSPELRDLSEAHHYGLVAARALRRAAAGEQPLEEAIAGFLTAWRDEIRLHFRQEEEVLLPEYARAVPPDDPLILRTVTEHVALRRAVGDLENASGDRRAELAARIGQALDDHIRFEERVLFPAIESALAGAPLEALGHRLEATRQAAHACPGPTRDAEKA
jgi:hemerythrin-like domain-containing protein